MVESRQSAAVRDHTGAGARQGLARWIVDPWNLLGRALKRRNHAAAILVALAAITAGAFLLVDGDGAGEPETSVADAGNSASRLIFWTGCEGVVSLSDAELDAWKERGVDGFVCMVGHLQGLGGDQGFTADPAADLEATGYELQRSLRDSRIAERAAERGMKLYLGAYLVNYRNTSTPLEEWFDDPGWSSRVLPRVRELAGAARLAGFAGIAFDQELYPQEGDVDSATWTWSYPGNTHTEAEVRTQAKRRGEQLMGAILDAFPGAEIAVYHYAFPGNWEELVQRELNGVRNAAADLLHIDFWDGMTSVEGYDAIRFWDSVFYKSPHRGSWESALTYNANRTFATLSRRFSNWDYASERVHLSPFSWINPGPNVESAFDDARPPAYVEEQLLAFRRWGMGGEFANFVYGPLEDFDYSPYATAMRAASRPGDVDDVDPTLELSRTPGDPAAPLPIAGTARDDTAIRAVRWQDDRDGSGTARLRWDVRSGDYDSGYEWEMRWSLPASEITPGATEVTITAEDIKGNLSPPVARSLRSTAG